MKKSLTENEDYTIWNCFQEYLIHCCVIIVISRVSIAHPLYNISWKILKFTTIEMLCVSPIQLYVSNLYSQSAFEMCYFWILAAQSPDKHAWCSDLLACFRICTIINDNVYVWHLTQQPLVIHTLTGSTIKKAARGWSQRCRETFVNIPLRITVSAIDLFIMLIAF